ncbi:hypothetical protein HanRHA438_Chr11g0522741 [Helianthus annuus]|nr:hypothetical protein HanRHA438_Chr11g0522741 [Helianthus annuus]
MSIPVLTSSQSLWRDTSRILRGTRGRSYSTRICKEESHFRDFSNNREQSMKMDDSSAQWRELVNI